MLTNALRLVQVVHSCVQTQLDHTFVVVALDIDFTLTDTHAMVYTYNTKTFEITLDLYISITDINECTEGLSGCAHTCINTIGSYTCTCNPGYHLASDGQSCNGDSSYHSIDTVGEFLCHDFISIDIDECSEGTSGCAQSCTNTVGSYDCSCGTGFLLASDEHGCEGCINF